MPPGPSRVSSRQSGCASSRWISSTSSARPSSARSAGASTASSEAPHQVGGTRRRLRPQLVAQAGRDALEHRDGRGALAGANAQLHVPGKELCGVVPVEKRVEDLGGARRLPGAFCSRDRRERVRPQLLPHAITLGEQPALVLESRVALEPGEELGAGGRPRDRGVRCRPKRPDIRLDRPAHGVAGGFDLAGAGDPAQAADALQELPDVVAGHLIGHVGPEQVSQPIAGHGGAGIGQVGERLIADRRTEPDRLAVGEDHPRAPQEHHARKHGAASVLDPSHGPTTPRPRPSSDPPHHTTDTRRREP